MIDPAFSWGIAPPQDSDYSAPYDAESAIRDSFRDGASTSNFPPQSASGTAQSAAGIGIQNIKRGFLNLVAAYDPSAPTSFTTSSTSYVLIDDDLAGEVQTSGRPLMCFIRGIASIPTGHAQFSVMVDGREITDGDGLAFVVPSAPKAFLGMFTVDVPAGKHVVRGVYKSATGGLVTLPRSSRPAVIAVEI